MVTGKIDDKMMDSVIATILRLGVSLAALLVLLGGVAYLGKSGSGFPDYRTFHPFHFRIALPRTGSELIETGIFALILTPVLRVVFSVYAFARERDTVYVIVTLIVLTLLIIGWFTGQAA